MKTVEEKAKDFCENMLSYYTFKGDLEKDIVKLLKEQDRDTRHACVESLNERIAWISLTTGGELVHRGEAKDAIMNTTGGIK